MRQTPVKNCTQPRLQRVGLIVRVGGRWREGIPPAPPLVYPEESVASTICRTTLGT
jgi:hypothetical protein